MAGPLSSEEIEDVVSSVRRLVSNEQASRRLSRDLNADLLLLTPSLRVVSDTSPLAPLILQPEIAVADPPGDADSAAAPVRDLAEGAELVEADWEDEILWAGPGSVSLGEVALGIDEAEVVLPAVEAAERGEIGTEDLPQALADAEVNVATTAPIPFVPRHRRSGARSVVLEDAPQAPDTTAAADPSAMGSLTEPELAEAEAPTAPGEAQTPSDRPSSNPIDPGPTGQEPDELDDWPETAEPWTASSSTPVSEGSAPQVSAEIVDADGTALAVLDEAALQEIVRQMIRAELQGDLGERITRNVRKLVRAEINRALMARDLD